MPRRVAGGAPVRVSLVAALIVVAALLLTPGRAVAGPGGEARSILRDGDRPYTVVAGDADASASVQNPANLGYLQGFNAVVDFAINTAVSGRRGNAVGGFAAVPLPWDILALGVGVQGFWRPSVGDVSPTNADSPYGKLSFALAVPLMRWAPGLSLGLSYGRLFSPDNVLARGVNQLDLALSWRANRFVTLGLVARNLNSPRVAGTVFPAVLDPELALRPLGDPRLEFAFGSRVSFGSPQEQIRGYRFQPRGRILAGGRGIRAYVEAERVAYYAFTDAEDPDALPYDTVRFSLGLQFDTPHFGAALGPSLALGSRAPGGGLHGANGRLRASQERYAEVLPVRPRRVTRISLAGKRDDRDLAEVVWALDALARRGGGVVLVEISGTGLSLAQLEEVREALLRFQGAGGKVVVYLEGATLSHYFLASVGDRILAHPQAALEILGFSSRVFYWGELLAKLGVKAEFVRIAEYKGTPETYSRSGPSAPVARAAKALVVDRWNHVVRLIGRARAHDPAVISGWVDAAPWQPEDARRRGIVDELAWPDQLDAKLEAWLGRRVRIEAPPSAPVREGGWRDPAHVAVVHVDGMLVQGPSMRIPLLGIDLAGAKTLTKQIAALREDRDVKAVVVRINSPGGSVAASRDIARELDLTRERKPVVVSMGTMAASGGYYVATGGQYIYADATTLTGSIGIFYPKLDLSGFTKKFGIGVEMISVGDRATMRSQWKPYSDDERAAAMAAIRASYDRFIERVAAARAMTPEAADAVARGRVWSGVRAIEVGLVDRYGGMHEAVDRAARMASLGPGPGGAVVVRHYPPEPTLLERIRALFGLRLSLPLGVAAEPIAGGRDPLTGRALGLAQPSLRALKRLPAALWRSEGPEALAITEAAIEVDG